MSRLQVSTKYEYEKEPFNGVGFRSDLRLKHPFSTLKYHYEKYNDWALALAAYNGGGGRVNRAIKRARSTY